MDVLNIFIQGQRMSVFVHIHVSIGHVFEERPFCIPACTGLPDTQSSSVCFQLQAQNRDEKQGHAHTK